MATINPNSPSPTALPTGADAQPLEADDAAVEHFEKALQNQPAPAKSSGFFDGFVVDTTKTNSLFADFKVIPKPVEPTKKDDIIDGSRLFAGRWGEIPHRGKFKRLS
jgi:hypothetical protein